MFGNVTSYQSTRRKVPEYLNLDLNLTLLRNSQISLCVLLSPRLCLLPYLVLRRVLCLLHVSWWHYRRIRYGFFCI